MRKLVLFFIALQSCVALAADPNLARKNYRLIKGEVNLCGPDIELDLGKDEDGRTKLGLNPIHGFMWENYTDLVDDLGDGCITTTSQSVKSVGKKNLLVQTRLEKCQSELRVENPEQVTLSIEPTKIELVSRAIKLGADGKVIASEKQYSCVWK